MDEVRVLVINKLRTKGIAKNAIFDEEAIRECMMIGPNYTEKDYEYELKDDQRMSEWALVVLKFLSIGV